MASSFQPPLVWILEDDEGSRFVYEEILGLRYRLRMFERVEPFIEELKRATDETRPDVIVADLRLPDESFLSRLLTPGCHELLRDYAFLVVSSVDDVDVLRDCFRRGALDYITKPFVKNELLVKIERGLAKKSAPPVRDNFMVDPVSMTVTNAAGESVALTSKEFQILALLGLGGASRQEFNDKIWRNSLPNTKTVDIHICNLRKKLAPLGIQIEFRTTDVYALA